MGGGWDKESGFGVWGLGFGEGWGLFITLLLN